MDDLAKNDSVIALREFSAILQHQVRRRIGQKRNRQRAQAVALTVDGGFVRLAIPEEVHRKRLLIRPERMEGVGPSLGYNFIDVTIAPQAANDHGWFERGLGHPIDRRRGDLALEVSGDDMDSVRNHAEHFFSDRRVDFGGWRRR